MLITIDWHSSYSSSSKKNILYEANINDRKTHLIKTKRLTYQRLSSLNVHIYIAVTEYMTQGQTHSIDSRQTKAVVKQMRTKKMINTLK